MHFVLESSWIVEFVRPEYERVFDYNHLYNARFKVCY